MFLSRLVGEHRDPSAGRLRINQLESFHKLSIPIFEETLTAAHDNRMDHERQLIQEIVP